MDLSALFSAAGLQHVEADLAYLTKIAVFRKGTRRR